MTRDKEVERHITHELLLLRLHEALVAYEKALRRHPLDRKHGFPSLLVVVRSVDVSCHSCRDSSSDPETVTRHAKVSAREAVRKAISSRKPADFPS